jgi:hypothetical protein
MAPTPHVVFRDQGQWNIKSNNVHYGPYATQRDAILLRAERASTAKSCFRINSALNGLMEKTRIRRIAQTSSDPIQTLRNPACFALAGFHSDCTDLRVASGARAV